MYKLIIVNRTDAGITNATPIWRNFIDHVYIKYGRLHNEVIICELGLYRCEMNNYSICFERDEDRTWFILKWS